MCVCVERERERINNYNILFVDATTELPTLRREHEVPTY